MSRQVTAGDTVRVRGDEYIVVIGTDRGDGHFLADAVFRDEKGRILTNPSWSGTRRLFHTDELS